MSLSRHEQRELSRIDRMLSAEPTLRAVAALFPHAPRSAPKPRRRPLSGLDAVLARHATCYALISVLVAGLGLACLAVATSVHLEVVAAVGGAITVGATVLLVYTIVRHGAGVDPETAPFTSTSRGDLT
jgi:hypothetical protein